MKRTAAGLLALTLGAGVAAAGDVYNIELVGLNFVYNGQNNTDIDLVINTGDTVVWTWVSGFHNVVSGLASDPDAGSLFSSGSPTGAAGTTFEFTFDDIGVYDYHCQIHADLGMTSRVGVVPTPGATMLGVPGLLLVARRRR